MAGVPDTPGRPSQVSNPSGVDPVTPIVHEPERDTLEQILRILRDHQTAEDAAPGTLDLWIETRRAASSWLSEARSLSIRVPSLVACPFGQNVLINPSQPTFSPIQIRRQGPLAWDARLF